MDWSREEVEAIVADYLQMLTMELAGQSFNKTQHRRWLQGKLNGRSDASIEFKHCNISAAMIDLGFPYIRGYQPRSNYQALLAIVAEEQVRGKITLDHAALAAVQQPAVVPTQTDFTKVKSEAPKKQHQAKEAVNPLLFRAVKRDYLEREAQNSSLGLAGEEFVVQFEHWRLVGMGQHRLADRVEHVSVSKGDGLGYDVLSFESDGRERLIEVKTTTFGRDTPFFVSRGELALSQGAKDQFHLYRLFEFRKSPRLFDLPGSLDQHCLLDPVTYRASFG
ncbi:DUF3883 domain-containing protein [Polaromonas naphthalenivorans]|uniref:Protein NO VEIN C-terminal domain-containing protein n=1 Tax=Polaromonas naphthalenivorans (strain CJ2) TaxID=365044 RepID=A1VI50_POLNA|nr:DUF3883 domain-containing protein [Polaromonas naphthalenivorans]ABM35328.1 conserved hypothetical protein [Polaromonas naphthalenivorans CJ2]